MKKIKQFIRDVFYVKSDLHKLYLKRMDDLSAERDIILNKVGERSADSGSVSFTEIEKIKLDLIQIKQSMLSHNIFV